MTPEMISAIPRWHDGACAYGDRGGGGLERSRGPAKGCILPPLLFSVYLAALISSRTACYHNADADTLVDLVHLDDGVPEDAGVGAEEACAKVVRAVWGMLHAHDAAVVSRSPSGLTKMMVGVCGV